MYFKLLLFSLLFPATLTLSGQSISEKFPFDSKYLSIDSDKIHYIDEGEGDPILFLHGVPMSSYSYRNIVPHLSNSARCIALDFMGFGKSDKPEIDYSFDNQIDYLTAFIDSLNLENITFVMTDIGAIIGTNYAIKHPEKVKGMVFMEAPISDARTFHKNGKMMQRMLFWMGGKNKMGYKQFVKKNRMLKMLPMLTKRKLSKYEKSQYAAPFPTEKSRIPLFTLPNAFSKKGKNAQPGDMADFLNKNAAGLKKSTAPKLLLYGKPGMLVHKKVRKWANKNLTNLQTEYVGKAKHIMEEDVPHEIGEAIKKWYLTL